jgi:hypothetical protein
LNNPHQNDHRYRPGAGWDSSDSAVSSADEVDGFEEDGAVDGDEADEFAEYPAFGKHSYEKDDDNPHGNKQAVHAQTPIRHRPPEE